MGDPTVPVWVPRAHGPWGDGLRKTSGDPQLSSIFIIFHSFFLMIFHKVFIIFHSFFLIIFIGVFIIFHRVFIISYGLFIIFNRFLNHFSYFFFQCKHRIRPNHGL